MKPNQERECLRNKNWAKEGVQRWRNWLENVEKKIKS